METHAGRDAADEDAAAVRQVLAGDTAAFEGIVRRWQGRLVNLAWRFCRDRSLAEDMAQEAFVKAFRSLGAFRGESSFATWLTAIALNSYRTALRAREPVAMPFDPERAEGGEPGVEAALRERQRAEAIRQAVLTLPPRYRDPIALFYFQEMDLAETSRVLGLPEGTVKARLHRGRALLKRKTAARLG
jgi:RNA polymerase sigma-70 factor (ECF subfamily)